MTTKLSNKIVGYISPKQKYINTLENKIETLESALKDELFKLFMEKLGEPAEMARLKKENKKLRQELDNLEEFGDELENLQNKEILKEKFSEYEYMTDDNED